MNKLYKALSLVALFSLFVSACYWNDDVKRDQYGVKMREGKIVECVGPGIYNDGEWFADLIEVSAGTVTFEVTDPEVATKDSQLVGVTISIQARRNGDCESLKNLLTNWAALVSDENLISVISATANEGIKVGTRDFTLTGLLDDRNGLASTIQASLETDAEKYSVDIINVTVKNVGLDPKYAEVLQSKALLTVQIEQALREQDLIKQQAQNDQLSQEQKALVLNQQLVAEQAKTAVEVEIASREGKAIAARNEIYLANLPAYELERLRLLKDILGDKAVLYFVPQGTDLTLLLSGAGGPNVVPLPQTVTVEPTDAPTPEPTVTP